MICFRIFLQYLHNICCTQDKKCLYTRKIFHFSRLTHFLLSAVPPYKFSQLLQLNFSYFRLDFLADSCLLFASCCCCCCCHCCLCFLPVSLWRRLSIVCVGGHCFSFCFPFAFLGSFPYFITCLFAFVVVVVVDVVACFAVFIQCQIVYLHSL